MKKEIILAVGSSSWWKNIKIRRVHSVNIEKGFIGHYMHGTKICVVVVLE